ncbi:uncharacterized protein LOC144142977 [Haemaphysalis longicornis]
MQRATKIARRFMVEVWNLRCSVTLCVIAASLACRPLDMLTVKRLTDARANFGRIMRECSKEMAMLFKLSSRVSMTKRVSVICAAYNDCVEETQEEIAGGAEDKPRDILLKCGIKALHNKSSLFYTALNDTDEYMEAFHGALLCINQTVLFAMPLESIHDLMGLIMRFVATF